MTLLHLSPESREALHDHVFYGSVTVALVVLGSAASVVLGFLIQAGALR
ncbi:hypothetical protein AB0E56_18385 [Microbacterium sp. NPDC028030]